MVANTLEELLTFYRPDRYVLRGKEYVEAVKASHMERLEATGMTLITHHDSITGQSVHLYV